MSAGFQVVGEVLPALANRTANRASDAEEPGRSIPSRRSPCDENTICIVPIQGVTWTGLNDDVEALDKALDAYNKKTGFEIPIHVDAASGGFIPAVPESRGEMGLPPEVGALDLYVGHKYGLVYPGLGWVV